MNLFPQEDAQQILILAKVYNYLHFLKIIVKLCVHFVSTSIFTTTPHQENFLGVK